MDRAVELLALQLEWGADEAIVAEPIDRLAGSAVRSRPGPLQRVVPIAAPEGRQTEPSHDALALIQTLGELRRFIADFEACALRDTASNLVFATGNGSSSTLIIGEPPGREEDRTGEPFAGPEGQLLDQMLASIGLGRAELLLTSLLPWRPPGGRPASAAELALCLPFLHRLTGIVRPRRILLIGNTAARALLPAGQSRRRAARNWIDLHIPGVDSPIPGLTLPGLAEMLKTLPLRREAWAQLRMLRQAIDIEQTET